MKLLFSAVLTAITFSGLAQLRIKDKAPMQQIEMKSVNGSMYTLNSLKKDKGLVVIFSCNSCPFVVGSDDFPGWEKQYDSLYNEALINNIGFVLVNSNEGKRTQADSYEEMIKHAKEQNYTMPYVVDEQSALANAFGAKTTPHVYFFDQTLSLIYTGSIDNSWDKGRKNDQSYLFNAIRAQGKGKKIKPNTTEPKGCGIKRVVTPIKN
ncbi:MAG: redoxin family protein [Flavobacteriales bacterium]